MNTLADLKSEIKSHSNPKRAEASLRFFKTGKGEYGEGDKFYGLTLPEINSLVKKYKDLPLKSVISLLKSRYHEDRTTAVLILVEKYRKADINAKNDIYYLYINNTKHINNWDLVDISAPKIVGRHLCNRSRRILYKLAKSKLIWDKRIAIMSTFHFIRNNDFNDALSISKILLIDKHDLIQKAVGWMLREIGKRNIKVEEKYLKENYKVMPRTMLRYAIEKFPEALRKKYLLSKI